MGSSGKKLLLSIDGGGIRGIIPLYALVKLEEVTGKKSRDIFSFLAGTSTGAVIVGGLAAGIPASQILKTYLERNQELFSIGFLGKAKRVFRGWMYSTDKLHQMIAEELGPQKDIRINELPLDVFISAKRVSDGMPFYFVRDNPRNKCLCGEAKLIDCMTASAAAPTYFYPWIVNINKLLIGKLVDGGIGVAGNPVYEACVEAFYYNTFRPENTIVVSLGTGRFAKMSQPGWLGSWFEWILKELLNSPGEQQTEIVRRHFPQVRFYRLDPDLKDLDPQLVDEIKIDDIERVSQLKQYGEAFASLIDWSSILNETNKQFLINDEKTALVLKKRPVINDLALLNSPKPSIFL